MRVVKGTGYSPRKRGSRMSCQKGRLQYCRSKYRNKAGRFVIYRKSRKGSCNTRFNSFKEPLVARCFSKSLRKATSRRRPRYWLNEPVYVGYKRKSKKCKSKKGKSKKKSKACGGRTSYPRVCKRNVTRYMLAK